MNDLLPGRGTPVAECVAERTVGTIVLARELASEKA
jgi:hypothetical protein